MLIKEMQFTDLEEVLNIENDLYDVPWTKKIFADCLNYYKCFVVIDEDNNKIIGYGIISIVLDESHLLNIGIDKYYQNKGLGYKLTNFLINYAKVCNTRKMYLEVRESNKKALSLYKKFGFEQFGIRKNYYETKEGREDAINMVLNF